MAIRIPFMNGDDSPNLPNFPNAKHSNYTAFQFCILLNVRQNFFYQYGKLAKVEKTHKLMKLL